MKITRLKITKEATKTGFSNENTEDIKFQKEVFWIRDDKIIAVSEILMEHPSKSDKIVMEYVKKLNKKLATVWLDGDNSIGNVLIDSLDDVIPKQ